ncbi:MAG: acyl-CoA dehydratase activase [Pseudomonadota bacterium]
MTNNGSQAPASEQFFFCGVDVGASATKLVLLDATGTVRAQVVRPSGVDYDATAKTCLGEALGELSAVDYSAVKRTVSTGYGRKNVSFADKSMTELQCHGVGCFHSFPLAITVVDIGGQDNKVIRLDEKGRRIDFKMNRKCAAGTGAFLEEIALRLNIDVAKMDPLAQRTEKTVQLSSFCTVFAKTEILAHLRQGAPIEAIVRGAFSSVITRVVEMDPLTGKVVLTGGVVAHNPTIAEILAHKLGHPVEIPPHPQFTGALGAALIARDSAILSQSKL